MNGRLRLRMNFLLTALVCVCVSVCAVLPRSTTNWTARFAGERVNLHALTDKCRRRGVLFKSKFAGDSTLPGGCFRNCVHIRVDGREVKVFRTCCQINHSLDPPVDVLAKLAQFVFGSDGESGGGDKTLVKCILYPVLEVATMKLGFSVSEWKVCNLVNDCLPEFSATFWPSAKGRGGSFVLCNETAQGKALVVRCTAGGRATVLSTRIITRKPASCFVYRTGTLVTSNYERNAHGRLHEFLARHAALIASRPVRGFGGGGGGPKALQSSDDISQTTQFSTEKCLLDENASTGQAEL